MRLRQPAIARLSAVIIAFTGCLQACVFTAMAGEPTDILTWTTLGTNGGPPASNERAQPSNLLTSDGTYWLIDSGDGAADQLAKAGVSAMQIDGVIISHLHPDHFAGLYGLIARRWFLRSPRLLTIYGPPGTEQLVNGMIASLAPAERVGLGLRSNSIPPAAGTVRVIIIKAGETFRLRDIAVTATENSHYEPDSETGSQSLSFRFEKGGYAIGYTGDTGPSGALETAFGGVDLLVSEVVDMPSMIEELDHSFASMPAAQKETVIEHLRTHHLPPADVAKLARTTGAKELVLTHVAAGGDASAAVERIEGEVRAGYEGDFKVANDLDRF